MFSNFKLKNKLVFGFILPIFVLFISSIYQAVNIQKLQSITNKIKNEDSVLSLAASEMKFEMVQVQQWLTDVSATRGAKGFDDGPVKAEEFAVKFKKHMTQFREYYSTQKNEEKVKLIDQISKDFDGYYATGKEMSKRYIDGGPASGNAFMENFDKAAEELAKSIDPFIDLHIKNMTMAIEKSDTDVTKLVNQLKITLGFTALLCVFVLYFLMKSIDTINGQFAEIGRFAESLKLGNLNAKVNIDSADEVGILAKSFNSTIEFIHNAFMVDRVEWSDLAKQKENELLAKREVENALNLAEKEKNDALSAKQSADKEKERAELAVKNADMEKKKVEELVKSEKEKAIDLQNKVDHILKVVNAASNGDLTQTIKIDGNDAIGKMGQGLNHFFGQLREDFTFIGNTTKVLHGQSEELNTSSKLLFQNSDMTMKVSVQMKHNAEEVNTNIKNLSQSTVELKEAVSEISKQAHESAKFATDAIKYVGDVHQVGAKLEINTEDIARYLTVISNIARQTNLLALNATIEAARAGEAGKGFAVVANEVKELARQSADASDEITQKVETIKSNSSEILESIGKVSKCMDDINNSARIVASATEEQFATTDKFIELINFSVKEVEEVSSKSGHVNQSAVSTSEIINNNSQISKDLSKTSDDLNNIVKKFKFHDNDANSIYKKAS